MKRNHVTLNGVDSSTIKGLLISELPPIYKPLMRTQIEEIDGRDGDIITNLGYSSYERDMEIGLFGDYDIDEVIRFFSGSGTAVFSNEPDKLYRYRIIDEIEFERLARFKTATVTFYVQPFKNDAVDKIYIHDNQLIDMDDYTVTQNGVTLTVSDGQISVTGTPTSSAQIYIPIKALSPDAGDYTLTAESVGSHASACSLRLIKAIPVNSQSFGETYLVLQSNATVSLNGEVEQGTKYNYLFLFVPTGYTYDFTVDVGLHHALNSFALTNRGNTYSRPKVTIYGSGTINFYINGTQILAIDMGNSEYITIDAIQMNAYNGEALMNRSVSGDYDKLRLKVGKNTISWTGIVKQIIFEDYSRWI